MRCSETRVTESCQLPCGCWKLNSGALKDQSGLLPTKITFGTPKARLLYLKLMGSDRELHEFPSQHHLLCPPLDPLFLFLLNPQFVVVLLLVRHQNSFFSQIFIYLISFVCVSMHIFVCMCVNVRVYMYMRVYAYMC